MTDKYRESGVDISAGDSFVGNIRALIESTYRPEVRGSFGHYGALFSLAKLGAEKILLASSTDGVGTKLEITRKTGTWGKIGQDLVAMCANDILCLGARPLFFLDYMATGRLDGAIAEKVIGGIARACREINCSLVGGETAEMPGIYKPEDSDLAGFIVGWVVEEKVIDGSRIEAGDAVLGLPSSGFHSNGYSLIRKIIRDHNLELEKPFGNGEETLGEALARPTKLYGPVIEPLLDGPSLHGLAHITGGGLLGNLPRILPKGLAINLKRSNWGRSPIFDLFQRLGKIDDREMSTVFNDGIGMVLVVSRKDLGSYLDLFRKMGETVWEIGEVVTRSREIISIQ